MDQYYWNLKLILRCSGRQTETECIGTEGNVLDVLRSVWLKNPDGFWKMFHSFLCICLNRMSGSVSSVWKMSRTIVLCHQFDWISMMKSFIIALWLPGDALRIKCFLFFLCFLCVFWTAYFCSPMVSIFTLFMSQPSVYVIQHRLERTNAQLKFAINIRISAYTGHWRGLEWAASVPSKIILEINRWEVISCGPVKMLWNSFPAFLL